MWGAAGFVAWWLAGGAGTETIARWMLFAALVVTPLGLELAATPDRSGRQSRMYRAATRLQPIAAVLLAVSFALPVGVAALAALGWALVTVLIGLFGVVRFLPRGPARLEETCLDLGLLLLPVGGAWLVAARAGFSPGGYSDRIVLLTAIHFHYAGFAALLLTGLTGREIARGMPGAWPSYRIAAWSVILGTPLVATGIATATTIEVAGALVLTGGLAMLAMLWAHLVMSGGSPPRRLLLAMAAASMVGGMALAAAYALSTAIGRPLLSGSTMALVHGPVNAIGFVTVGLLAWKIERPPARLPAPGVPFSRLASRGRVGPEFFARIGAVAETDGGRAPRGLIDNLDEYRRADFRPEAIDPLVRAFYEQTAGLTLWVRPEWRFGFRLGARLFKQLAVRVEQINLPLAAERREDRVQSRILPLRDDLDGRQNVRGWVRTYAAAGTAVYVAAYSSHRFDQQTYMNIAFPLPGGNLASILRWEELPAADRGCGVRLTTLSGQDGPGDEGVYFANRWLTIRLPLNETIAVWPVARHDGWDQATAPTIEARHDMWLFGVRYLTLFYEIRPTALAGDVDHQAMMPGSRRGCA